MTKLLKFSLAPLLALVIFVLVFQVWKIDLRLPAFSYNNDALFHLFLNKNIVDTGWFVDNQNIGLPNFGEIFNIYDFPLQLEMLQILIIKFFVCFSDNPFLISNCFFITSFALIALSSFVVFRSFNIGFLTAAVFSVLYAFLPYHFMRNSGHLFLSNYAIVPLAIMVGMWIADNKLVIISTNKNGQYSISPNRLFFVAVLVSILIAISGVYYAYYSIVIFIFAWVLRVINSENFFGKNCAVAFVLCGLIFAVLLCLYLPTFFYHIDHGFNPHVSGRSARDSELFGLRIINLLLPVDNHYLGYFANFTGFFRDVVSNEWERNSESLGLIGSFGFVFLLLWMIGKSYASDKNSIFSKTIKRLALQKDEQNLLSKLAALNLLSVFFATSGGLVMLVSTTVPILRSHARFCVFIAFISLFAVAIIFDKIVARKNKFAAAFCLLVVLTFGILDQVGRVSSSTMQSVQMKYKFINDSSFISEIEKSLPPSAMVFVLPIYGFPEEDGDNYGSLTAYIHSRNLRWSYPAIAGRESSVWQKKLKNLEFKEFIEALKQQGFAGVYLDRSQYSSSYSDKKLSELERQFKSVATAPMMVSKNSNLVFFKI